MGVALDTAITRDDFIDKADNALHHSVIQILVDNSNRAKDDLFPRGWTAKEVVSDMIAVARKAELFTMSKEMMELTEHFAKTLPPQTIEPFDLPSDDGWLCLPTPLGVVDVRGDVIPTFYIMWSRRVIGQGGVVKATGLPTETEWLVIHHFTRMGHQGDPIFEIMTADAREAVLKANPMASLWGARTVAFGHQSWSFYDPAGDGTRELADKARSLHDLTIDEMKEDGTVHGHTMDGTEVLAKPDQVMQFLKTYWHLCQSRLTDVEHEELPRQYKRAMRRKEMPHGPVHIVVLRKKTYKEGDGGGWQLQYQYIRRAHWRAQWYGSGNAKYQRHILIAPAHVGPHDAPWREGPVVNVLQR